MTLLRIIGPCGITMDTCFMMLIDMMDQQSYNSKLAQSTPEVVVITHVKNFRFTIYELRFEGL